MKLKDFPCVRQAMNEIMMDQYLTGMCLLPEVEVQEWWEPKFKEAEAGLKKLDGHSLGQIIPRTFAEMPGYEDLKGCWSDPALVHFATPVDDLAPWLAQYAGMTIMQYFYAQEVLTEFFEGQLRERFQGAVDGSPFDRMLRSRRT